jgi:hypothetical protein
MAGKGVDADVLVLVRHAILLDELRDVEVRRFSYQSERVAAGEGVAAQGTFPTSAEIWQGKGNG